MDTKKVRLGSVSILLTMILLCVAVVAVLSITSARAEQVMTSRYAEWTSHYYELQNKGQRYLSKADALIQENGFDNAAAMLSEDGAVLDEEGRLVREISSDPLTLMIVLEKTPDGYQVTNLKTEDVWEEDLSLNLFP